MAETKKITTLYVVTDSEISYDNIGDIDGGMFDDEWLKSYIKSHGANKLYEKLAFMNRQIVNTAVEILKEKDFEEIFAVEEVSSLKVTRTEDSEGNYILTYSDDKNDNLFQITKDGIVL